MLTIFPVPLKLQRQINTGSIFQALPTAGWNEKENMQSWKKRICGDHNQ
jgi:hypothetical protein